MNWEFKKAEGFMCVNSPPSQKAVNVPPPPPPPGWGAGERPERNAV